MVCGNCGGEGHNRRTCTNNSKALAQQEAALTTATYDGRDLELNGEVLLLSDKRRKLVTHVRVLPDVTAIHPATMWNEGAFYDCTSLSSVDLPEGLTTIGGCAFYGCTSLSSVTLPEGLTTIGEWVFAFCTSLSSLTFPEGLTTIEGAAFYDCTSLSSLSLPEGLTAIGQQAFAGCTSLSSLSLPDGLITIGSQAFSRCTILEQRRLAAGHPDVVSYLRFSVRASRRYAVLASLARLRDELYARQAKRARHQQADDDALEEEDEEEELEEQAGVLRGVLAFDVIHSDDLWRHILEFV